MPASADSIEARFGYTAGDIARLAGVAVYRDVWHQSLPRDERLDIAWSAIAEHLYACESRPEPGELIRAAWRDLRSEADANWHTHGVSRTTSVFDGEQTMPSFARYWFTRNTQGPEEAIVEKIAVGQIWDALPEKYRRLIAALATTDDYGKAAAELGKPRQAYVSQLARARRAFRELWHEGETPSGHWGTDRRGDPDAAHNKTHPNRNAATDAMRQRKRRRDARNRLAGELKAMTIPRMRRQPAADTYTMEVRDAAGVLCVRASVIAPNPAIAIVMLAKFDDRVNWLFVKDPQSGDLPADPALWLTESQGGPR